MKEFQNGFTVVNNDYYDDERLNPTEMLLLSLIEALDNAKNCYATNDYFKRKLHVSERTVSRAVKHLVEIGYVEAEVKKDEKGTERIIKFKGGARQNVDRGLDNLSIGGATKSPVNNKNVNNINLKNKVNNIQTSFSDEKRGYDYSLPIKEFDDYLKNVLHKQIYDNCNSDSQEDVELFTECLTELLGKRVVNNLELFRLKTSAIQDMFEEFKFSIDFFEYQELNSEQKMYMF